MGDTEDKSLGINDLAYVNRNYEFNMECMHLCTIEAKEKT